MLFFLASSSIPTLYIDTINNTIHSNIPLTGIILPIGISFFTFQGISYIIDVYRNECSYCSNILDCALYISMFPQLIAGPIVRYRSICEELHTRLYSPDSVASGIRRFIIGLSKKVLIANILAITADDIFGNINLGLDTPSAWLGIICYTLQIYYDFSGYSDMAIGLGKILGFTFPENFNYPYISSSITEFWRRWHISLSTWFKEYIYSFRRKQNRQQNASHSYCFLSNWSVAWRFI